VNAYRDRLLDAEQRSQGEYDRLVASLSGGALGVSFAFVGQFIKNGAPTHKPCLEAAWTLWVLSLIFVLASHLLSVSALRRAVKQLDTGSNPNDRLGGYRDQAVAILNYSSGTAFIFGTISVGFFVFANM